jgi:F1F0 ATPase subunit 2
MINGLDLIIPLLAGILLGALFFGGLWWTVQKCLKATYPALWLLGSLLLRMGITLAGFYFVADGNWQRLIACLLGFILTRFVVVRLSRSSDETQSQSGLEANHATWS